MSQRNPLRLNSSPARVIVVHGLAANKGATWLLGRRLRRLGYDTKLFGYPSIRPKVEAHARRLASFLEREAAEEPDRPLHLVVHSMGGIITRVMLETYRPPSLRRVVMLGTPNQGSHAARRLSPWLSWLCQPLAQLSDAAHSPIHAVNVPQDKDIEIGVIAGSKDLVVAVKATHLPGLVDHHVVRSGHGELLFRRDVVTHINSFLRHGAFQSTATPSRVATESLDRFAKSA